MATVWIIETVMMTQCNSNKVKESHDKPQYGWTKRRQTHTNLEFQHLKKLYILDIRYMVHALGLAAQKETTHTHMHILITNSLAVHVLGSIIRGSSLNRQPLHL